MPTTVVYVLQPYEHSISLWSQRSTFSNRPKNRKVKNNNLPHILAIITKWKNISSGPFSHSVSPMSLLFDELARVWKPPTNDDAIEDETFPTPVDYSILSKEKIQVEVNSFKESLSVSEADICRIEQETREQRDCLKWFQMRRFRLTASVFGEICRRRQHSTRCPSRVINKLINRGITSNIAVFACVFDNAVTRDTVINRFQTNKISAIHTERHLKEKLGWRLWLHNRLFFHDLGTHNGF